MRREDLQHVVAAAAQIVGESEFIVVGSQSILGSYPDAPEALLRSQEADIYPRHAPDKAINIEGALGDGSHLQQTFGYYAHAVGPEHLRGQHAMCAPSRSAWNLMIWSCRSWPPIATATGISRRRH
jgi:hypothetical protein